MRRFEILLVCVNLLTFAGSAIPRFRFARWVLWAAFSAVCIAIIQVRFEGQRSQLVPAYTLAGSLFLIWFLRRFAPDGVLVRRMRANQLARSSIAAVGSICLVLSAALPLLLPVFTLPYPSGPYKLGTVTYHWTDAGRFEAFGPHTNKRRELLVQIWYPAKSTASVDPDLYLQEGDMVAAAVARLHNLPGFVLNELAYVHSNAAASAPVAYDRRSYPVLVYVEGLTGYRQMSTFQVEELVSHGYIVAGIDQPGSAAVVIFPDGHRITGLSKAQMDPLTQQSMGPGTKVLQFNGQTLPNGVISYFAQDIHFVLNELAAINHADSKSLLSGKLDLRRVGLFGVSYGGIVGADACLKDARLRACLVEDVVMSAAVVRSGLQQPAMWITRPADTMRLERQRAGGWTEADIAQTQSTMRAVYNHLPGSGYFVQIPGMFHIDLTDLSHLSPVFPTVGFSGPIGAQRAHDIINAYSLAFFDRHLKNEPAALLDAPAEKYPEVIFERRRP